MSLIDLTHIKSGDHLAIRQKYGVSDATHRLLVVERTTAEQVVCRDADGEAGEWRFLKSTGKQIGEQYRYAEIATPELVAEVRKAQATQARLRAARLSLDDLEGKHLHQLKLSVEQVEALAKAWTDIKAMGTAAVTAADSQNSTTCGQPL